MEQFQTLVGDLTIEDFSRLVGTLLGYVLGIIVVTFLITAFIASIIDGWLYRKGALYYGSLRYLNKLFKNLKAATSIQTCDLANAELRSAIHILRYQRVIPKIMYKRLLEKQEQIHYQRKSELFKDEYIFSM